MSIYTFYLSSILHMLSILNRFKISSNFFSGQFTYFFPDFKRGRGRVRVDCSLNVISHGYWIQFQLQELLSLIKDASLRLVWCNCCSGPRALLGKLQSHKFWSHQWETLLRQGIKYWSHTSVVFPDAQYVYRTHVCAPTQTPSPIRFLFC